MQKKNRTVHRTCKAGTIDGKNTLVTNGELFDLMIGKCSGKPKRTKGSKPTQFLCPVLRSLVISELTLIPQYAPCSVDNAYDYTQSKRADRRSFDFRIDSTSTSKHSSFGCKCMTVGFC